MIGVVLGILGKVVTQPWVANILVPSIARALVSLFERGAQRLEVKSAVKAAKAAQTAEELRNASKKLSDALASNQSS